MCWEIDYSFLAEQKKAQENRVKEERRAGVIEDLLNDANKQPGDADTKKTAVDEVVPAK